MEKNPARLWHICLMFFAFSCLGTETPETKGIIIDNPECFTDAMCDQIHGSAGDCMVNVCSRYQCTTDFPDRDHDGEKDASCCTGPDCTDCNDVNANVNTHATETCNAIDDNCDGQIDEHAVCGGSAVVMGEVCDGIDNNYNGQIDEFLYHPSDLFLTFDTGKPFGFFPMDGYLYLVVQHWDGSIWLDSLTSSDLGWTGEWALFNDGDTSRAILETTARDGHIYILTLYNHADGTHGVQWHSFDVASHAEVHGGEEIQNTNQASLIITDDSVYMVALDEGAGDLTAYRFDTDGAFHTSLLIRNYLIDTYDISRLQALSCDGRLGVIVLWTDQSEYTSIDYTSFDFGASTIGSTVALREGSGISGFEAGCSSVYTGMYLLYKQDTQASATAPSTSTIRLVKLNYLSGFGTADAAVDIDTVGTSAAVTSAYYHAHLINTDIGTAVIWNDALRLNFIGFDQRLSETIRFMNLTDQRPDGDFTVLWNDSKFIAAWPQTNTSIFAGSSYEITNGRVISCGE